MMASVDVRLRTSVIILLVGTILVTMAIVGSGILLLMVTRIANENQAQVTSAAASTAARVEIFLKDLQARVELTGKFYQTMPAGALQEILDVAREPTLDAIYLIDADGKLVAASIAGMSEIRTRELTGIDLSSYPLLVSALDSPTAIWSDKHISAVTGAVTLGLTAPIDDGGGAVIAELSLDTLLNIGRIARETGSLDFWIVDSKGEIVVDTNEGAAERINLRNLPIVAAAFANQPLPETMSFGGTTYQVSASYSETLGWLFVGRIPSGLDNSRLREVVTIVVVAFVGSVIFGLLLAPFWAQSIVRPLRAVANRAHQIASGKMPEPWPHSRITELNQLSSDLGTMAAAIAERQAELSKLNEELEVRVDRRTRQLTRSNEELSSALATVEMAKDELLQSEKLAAIGRLVAGLAHEMNTPLGNGRLAVTTLAEKLHRFEQGLADGLRRSDLENFVKGVRTTIEIAELNLRRASELIGSLKQVAADRTASRRRKFRLREVIDEVLLTLSPSLKRQPLEIQLNLPPDENIWLDSYPGELGQALSNLIENSIVHAFGGQTHRTISITVAEPVADLLVMRLCDDGRGMDKKVARRAFDPFFTTALGQGGTGLGLYIAHNAITNVLGGSINLESAPGKGTCFELKIPLTAGLDDDGKPGDQAPADRMPLP